MIRKTKQIITFTKTNQTIYLHRRHPKICNGQVDALDSKLYPVLLTVTRPIMTTSVDSAHVKTLQVGVSFRYYFIIKSLFFSSWLSPCFSSPLPLSLISCSSVLNQSSLLSSYFAILANSTRHKGPRVVSP